MLNKTMFIFTLLGSQVIFAETITCKLPSVRVVTFQNFDLANLENK